MITRRRALIGSLTVLLLVTLAKVTLAEVTDNAGFFGEDAVRQANFDLREIKKQYGKDLLVETYPAVPANLQPQLEQQGTDAFFQQWARQRGQAAKADGVVVLITKDPSHLQVTPGDKTKARAFTLEDRDRMRDALVTSFREKNYDQGLLGAVGMFRDTLKENLGNSGAAAAAPVERSNAGAAQRSDAPRSNPGAFEPSRTQETSRRPGGGGVSFWTILIWGIIILIVVRLIGRLFRGRSHPQQGFDPRRGGIGQPGYDPRVDQGRTGFGGGGFGTGLGGGLLGGLLGGWLGGRMFGHGSDAAHGAPPPSTTPPQEPGVFADQHDSEFAGPGGTFGNAGGGGGDFGGGDSGGGGDFGGGGDSGGGGDF